jgi:signal transduction histidine kinase
MQRMRAIQARLREMDPFRLDVGLTAILIVTALLESAFIHHEHGTRGATAVVAVIGLLPMLWRRRDPLVAASAFAVVALAAEPFDTFYTRDLTAPFVAMLLLVYTLARYSTGRRMWAGIGILATLLWVVNAVQHTLASDDVVWTFLLFGPPALAGRAMRSRVLLQRELREKAERVEADREERAREAVEHERSRIAAELQAVVAHGLSAMVVQAEGVPRVLAAGDTARAGEALALIEETGRDALGEMRRLLGVLRRHGEAPATAPQPSLSRADALVATVRAAGLPIELTVEGDPVPLAPGVDLTAYRVLQEALTSAAAADGVSRAEVRIHYSDRDVTLGVRDDRPNSDGIDEATLSALRDRVGLYGGALRAGARESGPGFKVTARLPREEVPA